MRSVVVLFIQCYVGMILKKWHNNRFQYLVNIVPGSQITLNNHKRCPVVSLSITIYISRYHHIFTMALPWTHSKFCVHFKLYCLHVIHGHLSFKIHLISSYSPTKPITPSLPSGLVRK